MNALGRLVFASSLSALFTLAAGCSAPAADEDAGEDELSRSDPNGTVFTSDPGVRVLSGYNPLLDKATSECLDPSDGVATNVGGEAADFYLTRVTSREELAKNLDVSMNAAGQIPKVQLSAGANVVRSFKRTATTTSFLVRAVRKYTVSNSGSVRLKPEYAQLLTQGKRDEFMAKCGTSYAAALTYEAQVIGLLQFETKTEEDARKVQGEFMGNLSTPVRKIASANADLKAKAESVATKTSSTFSLTIETVGFSAPDGIQGGGAAENTFERLDELRKQMSTSMAQDLDKDRHDYRGNRARNARPAIVSLASYNTVSNAPRFDYSSFSTVLGRADAFLQRVRAPLSRMQSVFTDEVQPFFEDRDQYRYNVLASPQLTTPGVLAVAREWEQKFHDEHGTLVQPLAGAINACLTAAGNGDYSACVSDPVIERNEAAAEDALRQYAQAGRIVRVAVFQPSAAPASYWNAERSCANLGMRLPRAEEVRPLGPAIMALATRNPVLQDRMGEVWLASGTVNGAACDKPYAKNNEGQGLVACETGTGESLPSYLDRSVLCVPKDGPVAALATP